MSRTATYHTTVHWKGEHWGHLVMGNGPEMEFSAPPDAHGHEGVFTPEDAYRGGRQYVRHDDVHLGGGAVQAQAAGLRVPDGRHEAC